MAQNRSFGDSLGADFAPNLKKPAGHLGISGRKPLDQGGGMGICISARWHSRLWEHALKRNFRGVTTRMLNKRQTLLPSKRKDFMQPDRPFGERRFYRRATCAFSIHIEDDRRSYMAFLRDLSLGGALLEPPPHFNPKMGQALRLTIPFRKRPGVVVVNAKILQARKDGLAVTFLRHGRMT